VAIGSVHAELRVGHLDEEEIGAAREAGAKYQSNEPANRDKHVRF
jgi:hypothetical protein